MMGDTNAVSVLEMAHRRQLVNAGVLRTNSLLLLERVYFDDLVLFSILHSSQLNELELEHCGNTLVPHVQPSSG